MLDSSENLPTNFREEILAKAKRARIELEAQERSQAWDYKILNFLKEKAAQFNTEVSMDVNGKTLVYYFGDKQVTLTMQLSNVRVGESGASGYMTMSKEDYENNPWFQEAYKAHPIELKLF